ncbi:hypothetical protein J2W48_001711 [Flavobacterium piscis]|uniref:Uncharacterized protein n=1 Tax=Flavobacterium piscis TaxID=1114874 RepID=A0ABU1Y6K8_9FLAO|nr:hypothetical protein [Flavobacterium piscis]
MNKKKHIIFLVISSFILIADIYFNIFSKDIKRLNFWIFLIIALWFTLKLKSNKKAS